MSHDLSFTRRYVAQYGSDTTTYERNLIMSTKPSRMVYSTQYELGYLSVLYSYLLGAQYIVIAKSIVY